MAAAVVGGQAIASVAPEKCNLVRLVYSTFRNVNKFSNLLAMKPIAFESNKTEVLSNFSKGLCQIGFYSLAFLVGCLFYQLLPPSPGLRPKAMIMTEGLKIVRSGQFSTLGDIPEVVSDTLNPGPEAFGSTKIHIGINLRNENLEPIFVSDAASVWEKALF